MVQASQYKKESDKRDVTDATKTAVPENLDAMKFNLTSDMFGFIL